MALIYHIAFAADWIAAQRDGEYRVSTRGRTLEQQGFIHAGTADQLAPVANLIYRDATGLIVLAIDEDRITSKIQYDDVPGWDTPFPHIYGPLNVDAVVRTMPLEPAPDGQFYFHAEFE
jgi:uncharacterized protein (DUF952 family)